MSTVEVRELRVGELPAAVEVLARGMRDNPGHVAAFGEDPERRVLALRRMFTGLFSIVRNQRRVCAVSAGVIVGFAATSPVGGCRPNGSQKLRIASRLVGLGPSTLGRVMSWQGAWARHDPSGAHLHFGPIAVDAHLQGQGIGSRLMGDYVGHLEAERIAGYLETDKADNVTFYERHGFVLTGETHVLGQPNWFMERVPGA